MSVEHMQLLNIFIGKRIKLTLKTSSYHGIVQRLNANKTLVLADVVNVGNGDRYPGTKLFFGHEVVGVDFVSTSNGDDGNTHDQGLGSDLVMEEFQLCRKTFKHGDDDDDDEEHINFVVIDDFYEKFGSAVYQIKRQRVISVGASGLGIVKNGRLCWLQIATQSKVYLFDILYLGTRAFKNGLAMILENVQILKVMHDCRAIAGCLMAQFGVKLANVFDTQVADVMGFHSETGGFLPDRVSTLHEVVSLHLKVASSQLSSLQMVSQFSKEREVWFKRPCPIALLKLMAVSVIHLQSLRLVLMDTLMTDYMALVDSYLRSHYESDGLQQVTMESVLELPRELKALQHMHQDRREQAKTHYPVIEPGLLARFQRQNESLSTASPPMVLASPESPANALPSAEPDPPQCPQPQSSPEVSVDPPMDASLEPVAPVAATASDSGRDTLIVGPSSVGMGRGNTGMIMNTIGRGSGLGNAQFVLPAIGRGLFFPKPPASIPGAGAAGMMSNPLHSPASHPLS